MNTNLMTKVELLTDKLIDLVDQGVDFTVEQAPMVVQELLWRERVWHLLIAVLPIVILFAGIVFVCIGFKRRFWERDGDSPTVWFILMMLCLLGWFISGMISITDNSMKKAITAWCAPRVHLIEYLQNLKK